MSNETTPIPDEKVLSLFKMPVKYVTGYIFDADNQMMVEARGWGSIQYSAFGELLQDRMGEMFAEAFNEKYASASAPSAGWVRCADRMPMLPNPLPLDTPDERPVIFFNIRHSSTGVWFPSYGIKAEDQFPLEKDIDRRLYDEGFGRENWEWLDESPSPPTAGSVE